MGKKKGKETKKKMATKPQSKAFLGLRVPFKNKEKLEEQARAAGVTLSDLCDQILAGVVNKNPAPEALLVEAGMVADGYDNLSDELGQLQGREVALREKLESQLPWNVFTEDSLIGNVVGLVHGEMDHRELPADAQETVAQIERCMGRMHLCRQKISSLEPVGKS